jgi:hypothetical protein
MKPFYPPNDLTPVTWEQIKEFYKEHWNEDLKEDWKEAFCFAWSQSRSMRVIDLLASGFRAAQHYSETRIKELETRLENSEMLATHGHENL